MFAFSSVFSISAILFLLISASLDSAALIQDTVDKSQKRQIIMDLYSSEWPLAGPLLTYDPAAWN